MGKQKTGQTKRLLKFLGQDECCVDCPPISPDEGNIIECRGGKLFAEAAQEVTPFSLNTINSNTIVFSGDGTEDSPLTAESLTAPIQNGIISGGEVTWISGYTYSVSPAIYYINGVQYTSPYTEITLDPADVTNNRIDVFVLTTSGTAEKITGTASTNPEQPSINTSTQLLTSFALVVANTTSPVGLSQEYIYRENAGTPSEWTASATGGIVVNSVSNPSAGTISIEGTAVATGNTITLIDSAASAVGATKNVLIFYIRSKATWNNNRRLNFQFRNGVTNVGLSVAIGNGLYGFDSTITSSYQRIVIPLSDFAIVPSDNIDRLIITASGNGGTLGFYIDDIELQGANIPAAPTGTTDNIGVFYVNKNYSGPGAAVVTGYTVTAINSTNGGYNTQLMAARMGDMNKAYPDPWAARNAAMQAMAAGQITKAYIRVVGGSQYTVGSDVAANNGPATGGATTATVADVGFSSANRTAVASLMKHNIFYHFEENSGLRMINRTYAINSGCFNVDATHTTFVSGIFGKGFFHHVYGEGDGTISSFSQRFIEINNTRCSVDFECHESALHRASFYLFSFKKLHINSKNHFTPTEAFGVALQGTTDANEGDGLPMSLVFNVENCYKGDEYYPYNITDGDASGLSRPLFALDVNNCVRQKNTYLHIKNLYVTSADLSAISAPFLGGINRDCVNYRLRLEIDNLFHKTDTVRQALLVTPAPLIGLGGGVSGNWLRQNVHQSFIIKNAIINAPLIELRTIDHGNALNVNNSITVELGNITRLTKNALTNDFIIGLPTGTGVGTVANSVVGERPTVVIKANRVTAVAGRVFNHTYPSGVPVYVGATTITGTFITKDGSPVVRLIGTGNAFVLKDATLIAKGAATNTIEVDNGGSPVNFYSQSAYGNLPYEAGITQEGVFNVDPDLANYL